MEEEKKESIIKAECPSCREYQDCVVLLIRDKRIMVLKCKKCGQEFLSVLVQTGYGKPLEGLSRE